MLARLGFPPKIVNLVRLFHENVTLEVDLDDDGNTIIIKYIIGFKQGDTLAQVLFLCYIQAVLDTLFPKSEDAGIEQLMLRSMQPKPAMNGEMAAGSLTPARGSEARLLLAQMPSAPVSPSSTSRLNCRHRQVRPGISMVCSASWLSSPNAETFSALHLPHRRNGKGPRFFL